MPDRRLLSSAADTVTRVEITDDHRRLVVARQPGGAWRFEEPKLAYAADPRAIDDWLTALGKVDARPAAAVVHPAACPSRPTCDV